jgi:ribonuclease Y
MNGLPLVVISSVIALSFGLIVGYLINRYLNQKRIESAEAEAKRLLSDAQTESKELVLAAKDEALKFRDQAEA